MIGSSICVSVRVRGCMPGVLVDIPVGDNGEAHHKQRAARRCGHVPAQAGGRPPA